MLGLLGIQKKDTNLRKTTEAGVGRGRGRGSCDVGDSLQLFVGAQLLSTLSSAENRQRVTALHTGIAHRQAIFREADVKIGKHFAYLTRF